MLFPLSAPTLRVRQALRTLRPLLASLLLSCAAGFSALSAGDASGLDGSSGDSTDLLPAQGTTFGSTDPGTKVLQRLDAVEYDNTVRDLTGTQLTLAADNFPADDLYDNLDNIAANLVVSPALIGAFTDAALQLGNEVSANGQSKAQAFARVAPCASDASVDAASCLRQVVQDFGRRAWRRPLTTAEVSEVLATAQTAGDNLPAQVGAAVTSLLSSPYFLFRVELDPAGSQAAHALSGYELASRLSYFLWRSCPDDELLARAADGSLLRDDVLQKQVARLLDDPRSNTLVTEFGRRWLYLNQFDTVTPDAQRFPNFTAQVRVSMQNESQAFLRDFLLLGKPLSQLLTANYSYLDDTLAKYYGLAPPNSKTPVRVALPASSGRLGLLSQGAMLVAGSTGATTSPIKRGKTILLQLMCAPLSAPPPGIPSLNASLSGNETMRQALSAHVADPTCAACHQEMDDVGFAFERFGGSGERRSLDNNQPIDTSGVFNGNVTFADNLELSAALATDPRFAACATKMLLSYALGRAPTDADEATVEGLTAQLRQANLSVPALIEQIVLSQSFRSRHS